MPTLFVCPHCGTKTQVDDEFSGHRGRCVSCDGEIEIPSISVNQNAVGSASLTTTWVGKRFRWIVGTLVCLILAGVFLMFMVRFGSRTMATLASGRVKTASIKNLEKIAKALNAYAADHGNYPPSITTNDNNQPMHSWRVLILPYLGEQSLYDQIERDLPWDHVTNRTITDYQMPGCYGDVRGSSYGQMTSHYYLITGPGTLFPSTGPLGPLDVLDKPSQTILVVEGLPTQFPMSWTQPVDMDVLNLQSRLPSTQSLQVGNASDDGAVFATVDGRGHSLTLGTPPSVVDALLTPAGNERLADDTLD